MNDYIKHFLRFNWFGLWIVMALTVVINTSLAYFLYTSIKEIKYELKESSKKVVGLSTLGSMVYAEKQSIDVGSEEFKMALKNILLEKLIVDAKRITKDSTYMPKTEDEILKSYEPLEEFYTYFLDNLGKDSFVKYIRDIGFLVNSDNLVETITPIKTIVTRYIGNTKGFEIEIVVNCALTYFLKEAATNRDGVGTITIYAAGDFNPAKGTIQNPLGINVFKVIPTLIKKPRK